MNQNSILSIIVPVYNEINTIEQLINRLESVSLRMYEKQIIIVDDYSSDGTRELLLQLQKKKKNYNFKFHNVNRGKGSAIRTGLRYAIGLYVIIQDGDLEYNPQDIGKLLNIAHENNLDVVFGSRTLNKNNKSHHSGYRFLLGGIFLTFLTNMLYGIKISDEPTCYKLIKRNVLLSLNLSCERFEFCPEVTAKISKKGLIITDVPIDYYPRRRNEGKKINWVDGIEAIWTLIKLRLD